MKNKGSLLILFIPAVLVLGTLLLLLSRWGHAIYVSQKAETTARAIGFSSLSLKVDGYRSISEKWEPLHPFFLGGNQNGAVVAISHWNKVIQLAADLKKSLPGYKGRVKAVVSVVADANHISREAVRVADDKAYDLGLVAQGQWLTDPAGNKTWAEGLWIQRTWDPAHRLGQPSDATVHEVEFTDPVFGPIKRTAAVRLGWDVSSGNPTIQSQGNGGFPRNWSEALNGGTIDPLRYPYFRVVDLKGGTNVREP